MQDWGQRIRTRAVGGLLVLLVGVMAPCVGAATDEERAAARSLAEQGSKAFAEQRFEDAVDLFTRAEGVVHSPVHLLFTARAHVQLGQLVKAQEAYIKITREELDSAAPDAFKSAASEAAAELEALKPRIPHLTIQVEGVQPGVAQVSIDGEAVPAPLVGVPVPVDPGTRQLEARAEGYDPVAQEVAVAEGQNADIQLVLVPSAPAVVEPAPVEPSPPPTADSGAGDRRALRYGAYGALGVGAIGVGVGTYFLIDAAGKSSDADELLDSCTGSACDDIQDDVLDLDDQAAGSRTASLISFIVGGIGIGTGITLWVLSSDKEESATAPRIVPWVGYNSAGVSGTF